MQLRVPTGAEKDAAERQGYHCALASIDGQWFLGYWPVLFGVRVIAWRDGSTSRSVDYCAGSDAVFSVQLLNTIARIFRHHLSDGATEDEVTQLMPPWQQRPIHLDPCWQQLQELADAPAALQH